MDKKQILNSIFPVIFTVLFFVVGGIDQKASAWISFVFIHFAYFMLLFTPRLLQNAEQNWTALGFSLYYVSALYFAVELFIGILIICLALESYKIALLIQLPLAGIYVATLIANKFANERTVATIEKRKPQIAYVKNASASLKGLWENISEKETAKKVERVYDAMCSSPVKSHPDLEPMENQILEAISALEDAVTAGNRDRIIALADSLETAINDRNRRLKAYN
jgi:ribosomal protein L34E